MNTDHLRTLIQNNNLEGSLQINTSAVMPDKMVQVINQPLQGSILLIDQLMSTVLGDFTVTKMETYAHYNCNYNLH